MGLPEGSPPTTRCALGARVVGGLHRAEPGRVGAGAGQQRRGRPGLEVPPPRRRAPPARAAAAVPAARGAAARADRDAQRPGRPRTCRTPRGCPPRSRSGTTAAAAPPSRGSRTPRVDLALASSPGSGRRRPPWRRRSPASMSCSVELGDEHLAGLVLGRWWRAWPTCRRSSRPAAPAGRRRSRAPAGSGPGPSCRAGSGCGGRTRGRARRLDEVAGRAAELPSSTSSKNVVSR